MDKLKTKEYVEKKICQEYNDGCMGFDKCKEYYERYHNAQKYWKDGAEFADNGNETLKKHCMQFNQNTMIDFGLML